VVPRRAPSWLHRTRRPHPFRGSTGRSRHRQRLPGRGHAEVTDTVTRQIVVGQMLGLIEGGRFIATGGVRPGDVVIQVGPVPIKGAAALAREAAHRLGSLDRAVVRAAIEALREPGISVVEPALLASDLEASSLHDPPRGVSPVDCTRWLGPRGSSSGSTANPSFGSRPGPPSEGPSGPTRGLPSRPGLSSRPSLPTGPRRLFGLYLPVATRRRLSGEPSRDRGCGTRMIASSPGRTATRPPGSCLPWRERRGPRPSRARRQASGGSVRRGDHRPCLGMRTQQTMVAFLRLREES